MQTLIGGEVTEEGAAEPRWGGRGGTRRSRPRDSPRAWSSCPRQGKSKSAGRGLAGEGAWHVQRAAEGPAGPGAEARDPRPPVGIPLGTRGPAGPDPGNPPRKPTRGSGPSPAPRPSHLHLPLSWGGRPRPAPLPRPRRLGGGRPTSFRPPVPILFFFLIKMQQSSHSPLPLQRSVKMNSRRLD